MATTGRTSSCTASARCDEKKLLRRRCRCACQSSSARGAGLHRPHNLRNAHGDRPATNRRDSSHCRQPDGPPPGPPPLGPPPPRVQRCRGHRHRGHRRRVHRRRGHRRRGQRRAAVSHPSGSAATGVTTAGATTAGQQCHRSLANPRDPEWRTTRGHGSRLAATRKQPLRNRSACAVITCPRLSWALPALQALQARQQALLRRR